MPENDPKADGQPEIPSVAERLKDYVDGSPELGGESHAGDWYADMEDDEPEAPGLG